MVKFFVLSRFIVRFYKSNIVFLYFLVISHNFTMYFQKGFFMINSNTFQILTANIPFMLIYTRTVSAADTVQKTPSQT